MDGPEFRTRGREMVDYIVDYMENISDRRVTPNIEPGYLQELIPKEPPQKPEEWEDVMKDVEDKIMVGVTHWQHPRFHAYFPAGNSYPSILGDMLGDAIGCVGFSWAASPACTELETIMLDWMGKMIGLPDAFLTNVEGSRGGGVIQSSASECILDSLLAARAQMIQRLKSKYGDDVEETTLLSKMMAYCSKEAHSSVEKAAMISFVKLRILEPDENCSLRGDAVRQAMEEDVANGMYPFFVSTTLGTTGCCAFDNVEEIGPLCEKYGAWLHVDAAYGGNAFICPEFQYLMKGVEYASSMNMNPNKWMLVNFDCSLMWVRDRFLLTQALVVDPLYLQHSYSESAIDYRHWGIPLSRRFRSLKLWFVIRNYGVEGLQAYVREHCRLAKCFEVLVRTDKRFEICNNVRVGLVCFRLIGSDELNQMLLSTINSSGKLHMVPASVNEKFVIRFCVCAQNASDDDIKYAWETIAKMADAVIKKMTQAKQVIAAFQTPVAEHRRLVTVRSEPEGSEEARSLLAKKRSYFVRMVSDPKIYNPKIVVNAEEGIDEEGESTANSDEDNNDKKNEEADDKENKPDIRKGVVRKQNGKKSWISWPLAFILASGNKDATRRNADVATLAEKAWAPEKEVSMRFRNMSARLTIPSPNHRENGETKKILGSPNGEFGDDQTLEIVDTGGAAEESKLNGVPEFPMGTKPKIILHRQKASPDEGEDENDLDGDLNRKKSATSRSST